MGMVPPGVGPHEGQEFDLMRDGKKHVALFSDWEPEGLEEILADGFEMIMYGNRTEKGTPYYTRIVFRPGYETQALRLKYLTQNPIGFSDPQSPEREHEVGSILGYTPDQVEAFLNHVKRGLDHVPNS